MTRYLLTLFPHSSLFVGGYAESHGQSDGDSAFDDRGLLLPGSAVKGALREAAVRLVNGAGRGQGELHQLFGVEKGPPPADGSSERDHLRFEGKLRVLPLRAAQATADDQAMADGAAMKPLTSADSLALRHHASLERANRQAAPQRLFQNRVTPAGHGLVFRGEIQTQGVLSPEQEGLLFLAVRLIDQVGGGRGRGLGHVRMELERIEERKLPPHVTPELPKVGRHSLVLEFEAIEPLQLGVVKDAGNLVTSKECIDGSALRGAVAAFVAHAAPASEVSDLLEDLMGKGQPVEFGDACAGHANAMPAPLTLWENKGQKGPPHDLAVDLATGEGPHRLFDYRPAGGVWLPADDVGWRQQKLKRRTVTRTARNVASGRGDEGRLFSQEVIDPVDGNHKNSRRPLRFYATVRGTADQLHWVVRAAEEGIQVGRARTRGFGRLRLVDVFEPDQRPLKERHRLWVQALDEAGCASPEAFGVFFAIGPLALDARRLKNSLSALNLEVVAGSARRRAHGGWNRKAGLPRNLAGHFVPGSTWIVRHTRGNSALEALKQLEERGLGPGRADGWGRLAVCHELHLDARPSNQEDVSKEEMP